FDTVDHIPERFAVAQIDVLGPGPGGWMNSPSDRARILVDQPITGCGLALLDVAVEIRCERVDGLGTAVRVQPLPDVGQPDDAGRRLEVRAEQDGADPVDGPERRGIGVVAEAVAPRDAVPLEQDRLAAQGLKALRIALRSDRRVQAQGYGDSQENRQKPAF